MATHITSFYFYVMACFTLAHVHTCKQSDTPKTHNTSLQIRGNHIKEEEDTMLKRSGRTANSQQTKQRAQLHAPLYKTKQNKKE